MKKQLLITTLVFFFVLANITYAANTGEDYILIEKQANLGSENGQKVNISGEAAIQQSNENRVQTQENNQGESNQIQMQVQVQTENGELIEVTPVQNQGEEKQNRSNVSEAVHQILESTENMQGGIGAQVRVVAQAQNENNLKLEESVKKIQNRNTFSKIVLGPDYKEVSKAEALLAENKTQIEALVQLKDQVVEEENKVVLEEQINLLLNANTEIENVLENSQKGFSFLGWVFKLFK